MPGRIRMATVEDKHFVHATVGQLVRTLVAGVANVAADPFPGHLVAVDLFVE